MHLHAYSNSSWSIIMSWWTNGYSRFRILPMGVQSNVHRYNWHMHLSKSCCRVLSLLCLLCARNVRTAHTRSPCTLDNWSPFVSVFMRTTDEKKVNSVNIFELRTVFANSNYGSPFKPCASAIERCDFEILSRLFCFGGIELILTTNCLLILIQSPAFACDVNVNIGLTITCLRLFWDGHKMLWPKLVVFIGINIVALACYLEICTFPLDPNPIFNILLKNSHGIDYVISHKSPAHFNIC